MGYFTPELPNPYPEPGWRTLSEFEYGSPLWLYRGVDALKMRDGDDADYVLAEDYTVRFRVDDEERQIIVPAGMLTDLASVPRLARSVVGRVGPHLEAAIVHDFLYIAWQDVAGHEPREADRYFADELMRVAMEAAKINAWMRFVIHRAVRTFGGRPFRTRDQRRYWRPDQPMPRFRAA